MGTGSPIFTFIEQTKFMTLNQFSFIPADSVAPTEALLLKTFNTIDITDLLLLTGGLSGSSVYKLVIGSGTYILKLTPVTNKIKEYPSPVELSAAAGIAPKLYAYDRMHGISISAFVENVPVGDVFTSDDLLIRLADLIKSIHAIPFEGPGVNIFETIDGLIYQFNESNMMTGPVFDECFRQYELLKSKYPIKDADSAFSHNDLNPGNILCDGKQLLIIDWDVATLNNRYVDLANSANFFVHTEDRERAFLKAYFGYEAANYEMACFYTMRQLCRIIYSMLMFNLAARQKPAGYLHSQEMDGIDIKTFGTFLGTGKLSLATYDGQLFYAKALLNTAVAQMRTPRFANALAQF